MSLCNGALLSVCVHAWVRACASVLMGSSHRAADGSIKDPLNGGVWSGKCIADVEERISTQVEWPFTARRQESNPGEADGRQDRHSGALGPGNLDNCAQALCHLSWL